LKAINDKLTSLGKVVKICCSTGIACHNFDNASTIHSFLGLCDGRFDKHQINSIHKENSLYSYVDKNLKEHDCIIVDECSMISKRTFESIVQVCSRKEHGMQLIFCGDYLQLPPVANELYMDFGEYCFQSEQFAQCFPHRIQLQTVYRTADKDLLQAIHGVFTGQLTEETVNFIDTLKRPLEGNENDIKLFANNNVVDEYNIDCINNFPGELHEFLSTDEGDKKYLQNISAPHHLWLKIGCPVILLQTFQQT
jgi:ATP-dependent DNA helicase PIF1